MIILSQNGKEIINFDNVNLIRVQDDGNIVTYDNTYNEQTGVSSVLGKYETEERAKGVLKDIISRYEAIELCRREHSISDILGYTLGDYTPIYEMPTE